MHQADAGAVVVKLHHPGLEPVEQAQVSDGSGGNADVPGVDQQPNGRRLVRDVASQIDPVIADRELGQIVAIEIVRPGAFEHTGGQATAQGGRADFRNGRTCGDLPCIHHNDPIRNLQHFFQRVADIQNGQAMFAAELLEVGGQFGSRWRIERRHGLVE